MVHGSGPCERATCHVAARVAHLLEQGLSVLVYDKPGCGGSDGDWTEQTLQDRAAETRAAVAFLHAHSAVAGRPIALVGQSQGGWVSLIAAARDVGICAVVATSGPGVSVAEQEIYRLGHDGARLGLSPEESGQAVAFLRRRIADIAAGRSVQQIFDTELAYHDASWRAAVGEVSIKELSFDVHAYPYDPVDDLRSLRTPLLAVFGGADTVIPVRESITRYLDNMADADPRSRLLVVPNADHRLRLACTDLTPPGLWKSVADWLRSVAIRSTTATQAATNLATAFAWVKRRGRVAKVKSAGLPLVALPSGLVRAGTSWCIHRVIIW
jgi:pimeloyl-ACP methyl ester carboxylesterase